MNVRITAARCPKCGPLSTGVIRHEGKPLNIGVGAVVPLAALQGIGCNRCAPRQFRKIITAEPVRVQAIIFETELA